MKKYISMFFLLTSMVSCESSEEEPKVNDFSSILGDYGGTYTQTNFSSSLNDCAYNGRHKASIKTVQEFLEIDVNSVNGEDIQGQIFYHKELKYDASTKTWSANISNFSSSNITFSFNEITKELTFSLTSSNFSWSYNGEKDEQIDDGYVSMDLLSEASGDYIGKYRTKYGNGPYSDWHDLSTSVSKDANGDLQLQFNSSEITFKYRHLVEQVDGFGFTTVENCPGIRSLLTFDNSNKTLTAKLITGLYEGEGLTYYFEVNKQ